MKKKREPMKVIEERGVETLEKAYAPAPEKRSPKIERGRWYVIGNDLCAQDLGDSLGVLTRVPSGAVFTHIPHARIIAHAYGFKLEATFPAMVDAEAKQEIGEELADISTHLAAIAGALSNDDGIMDRLREIKREVAEVAKEIDRAANIVRGA